MQRPLAVGLSLALLRFKPKEIVYITWVGLPGAVPIVLASLALQGGTIGWLGHRQGVVLPDKHDTSTVRAAFGDFVLQANTRAVDSCDFFGLQPPTDAGRCVDA